MKYSLTHTETIYLLTAVLLALKGLLKKGESMSFSKVIQIGSIGQFSLNEDKGVASVKVEVSHGLAGEAVKGVASAEIDVSAVELAQLALDFIKSKLPSEAQALVSALEAVAIPALKNL